MPSTRPGASYNPSRSSQKGHRHDYGRSQSATEEQGSVDDLQINKLCHSEADNTVLPSNRAETATRSHSGHIQSHPEGLQQCISVQRCHIVECDLQLASINWSFNRFNSLFGKSSLC
ncbi:hypothetical protein O181_123535 [Austropuccinia psidii MF-1]|uniref:Uncharacterized protein n=1 Tax=Austropuccinia psidii MF-1 TaxID=1389203 RepID=A0A9Q3Q4A9_9BASI|nr:hypothetical protein [Austropuccinia psidii MF-1]